MKKKIAILGSTGSIGKSLINIINQDENNFKIILLTANKNYKSLLLQAMRFKVKNVIITDKKIYKLVLKKKIPKLKIYNNFKSLDKIFKKKIDYCMSAITGLDGLIPTYSMIKYAKKIAIANKESLICAWNIFEKAFKKFKTEFIPVDSEHFSIWSLKNTNNCTFQKVYITASGGPFLNYPSKLFKNINLQMALKHPNWKMGKKISIDSATMMNKVFELIEARNIFNLKMKQLKIIIHPKSYIHAIVKMSNGLIKIVAHETTMKIPIQNTLYTNFKKNICSKEIDISKLNNLNLRKVDLNKFPLVNVLNKVSDKKTLYETVIVSANDEIVNLFLLNKISFVDIPKYFFNIINLRQFIKYKKKVPDNINQIIELSKLVRLKIKTLKV